MRRSVEYLLIRISLILALTVSGVQVAAAQLSMAIETATISELVICADGQVKTVVVNSDGQPVEPKSRHYCSSCPECQLTAALGLPAYVVAAPILQRRSIEAPVLSIGFTLLHAKGPAQARAPPKGL